MKISLSLWIFLISNMTYSQYFAEKSYEFWHEKCPKGVIPKIQLTDKPAFQQLECANPQSEVQMLSMIGLNYLNFSEDVFLASLAKEKIPALQCRLKQVQAINSIPQIKKNFERDLLEKVMALGEEKILINQLRDKGQKTKEELEQYDQALKRSILIYESIPFEEIPVVKNFIAYAAGYYDRNSKEVNDKLLPDLLKKQLGEVSQKIDAYLVRKISDLSRGAESLGKTFDNSDKESLAQDYVLIDGFVKRHADQGKNFLAVACRVNAKFGKGAEIRDNTLEALGLLSLPVGGLLGVGTKAMSLGSKIANGAGRLAIQSSKVLSRSAMLGGSFSFASGVNKACVLDHLEFSQPQISPNACNEETFEGQNQESCFLTVSLTMLGAQQSSRLVSQFLKNNKFQRSQAILKAHYVGHGVPGRDGTLARVGNYTPKQILEKARILKQANISKKDRRELFELGIVGDDENLEKAIQLTDQLNELRRRSYKVTDSRILQGLNDDLLEVELKIERAIDSNTAEDEAKKLFGEVEDNIKKIDAKFQNPSGGQKTLVTQPSQLDLTSGVDLLLSGPEQLKNGKKIFLMKNIRGEDLFLNFSDESLDQLKKIDPRELTKFANSLRSGFVNGKVDLEKVKMLTHLSDGPKGRVFEVRIRHESHARLLGCVKNNVYTIYHYDHNTPEVFKLLLAKYNNLCK